jgi:hypothetical protein
MKYVQERWKSSWKHHQVWLKIKHLKLHKKLVQDFSQLSKRNYTRLQTINHWEKPTLFSSTKITHQTPLTGPLKISFTTYLPALPVTNFTWFLKSSKMLVWRSSPYHLHFCFKPLLEVKIAKSTTL